MDPNETLRRIRSLVLMIEKDVTAENAQELAELTRALDGWMSKGGFAPTEWQCGALRAAERMACTNSMEAQEWPREYRGHWIVPNDERACFEVHETPEGKSVLWRGTLDECEDVIDEVVDEA